MIAHDPTVMRVKGSVNMMKTQNCFETWKVELSADENANRFMPRMDYGRSSAHDFLRRTAYQWILTATKLAGRYIRVTIVTSLTVALSSTLSLVKLQILRLILTAVAWLLRFSATPSLYTRSQSYFASFDIEFNSAYEIQYFLHSLLE